MSKTLHLTLKKKWFDMILSGVKKEEYREIKSYWMKRLLSNMSWEINDYPIKINENKDVINRYSAEPVNYETITFKNGYSKNAPEMVVELLNITTNEGISAWGAEKDVEYFVLSLGKILSTKNIKNE